MQLEYKNKHIQIEFINLNPFHSNFHRVPVLAYDSYNLL